MRVFNTILIRSGGLLLRLMRDIIHAPNTSSWDIGMVTTKVGRADGSRSELASLTSTLHSADSVLQPTNSLKQELPLKRSFCDLIYV